MENETSISAIIKEEIIESKILSSCCKKAFLSGAIRGAGSYYINSEGFGIVIQHQNNEFIAKCAGLVKNLVAFEPVVKMRQRESEKNPKIVYEADLPGAKCFDLLEEAYISPAPFQLYDGIAPELIGKDCCKKAFLQGLFLASGTVSIPSSEGSGSAGYYLDISLTGEKVANDLQDLLNALDFGAKTRKRGEYFSVYIKDAEKISDICAFIGAMRGVLEIQNVIVMRSIRNVSNRQSNCETANVGKAVEAGIKQYMAIKYIFETRGQAYLEEPLRSTAIARLENPDMTLTRLSEILDEHPSKSCLNHRLRKILAIAEELGMKE